MGRGSYAKLKGVLILIYRVRPGLHCYKGVWTPWTSPPPPPQIPSINPEISRLALDDLVMPLLYKEVERGELILVYQKGGVVESICP